MGELEKYGILSVGSVLVLFLVLSFRGGLPDDDGTADASDPRHSLANGVVSEFGVVLGSSEFLDAPPPEVQVERRNEAPRGDTVVASAPASFGGGPGAADAGVPTGPLHHVVVAGDTLGGIAKRYLGSENNWKDIRAVNNGLDPRKLRVGQRLLIPAPPPPRLSSSPAVVADRNTGSVSAPPRRAPRTEPKATASSHKIASGDTLSGIAKRYYSDARVWKKVFDANRDRLKRADVLPVGTIITLP